MLTKDMIKFIADILKVSASSVKYLSPEAIIQGLAKAGHSGMLNDKGQKMVEIIVKILFKK